MRLIHSTTCGFVALAAFLFCAGTAVTANLSSGGVAQAQQPRAVRLLLPVQRKPAARFTPLSDADVAEIERAVAAKTDHNLRAESDEVNQALAIAGLDEIAKDMAILHLARAGNAHAAYAIGWLYERGTDQIASDPTRAARLYAIAGNPETGNNPLAQQQLAGLYRKGLGVPSDNALAEHWLELYRQNKNLSGGVTCEAGKSCQ